ncbi:hypothetical protein NQ314_017060 [Rhamnusium bicolor]|uniref:PHD-type domain-containing protein n=1 Tax=Rhamnusium bicolor TaxID=1586634 RepID=A0AAV8WU77_9CUCU|nr:hypothetical protein NQ314_017060 [Rhamnusium bicolor]
MLQQLQEIKKRGENHINTQDSNNYENNIHKTEEIQKSRIRCSRCEDELISDTEDNDLKNIGCDKCTNWYHLKCTGFKGKLYEEVAFSDFICGLCIKKTTLVTIL